MSSESMTVQSIPLSQLRPDSEQPRRFISPSSIQTMAASLLKNGQRTPIKVRPLTEAEKAQFAPAQYLIIGGHRRYEGAKAAGLSALNALVQDLTPKEANLDAMIDNEWEDMTWLDKDLALAHRAKTYDLTTREIAEELKVSQSQAARAIRLAGLLTPKAIELIDENLAQTPPEEDDLESPGLKTQTKYTITRKVVLALTALDSEKMEEGLQAVLSQRMTESQARALAASMLAGNSADTYKASKAVRSSKLESEKLKPTTPNSPLLTPHSAPAPQPSSTPTNGQMGSGETLAWDVALGISVLSRIKAKVKKGERPTFGEALLLAGDKLVHLIIYLVRWVSKNGIRGIFRVMKWFWHTFIESLKLTGLYPLFRAVMFLAFFIFAIWFGWEAYHYGFFHPVKVVAAKVLPAPLARYVMEQPTPVPTAVPVVVATPVPTVQAAVISTPTFTEPKPLAVAPKKTAVTTVAQPTPTVAKAKTDVAGDVLKQAAPAGVDAVRHLLPF